MSNFIADARAASDLTLRDVAERLGVTAAAVHQYERSERAGSIGLRTLERVLGALGYEYLPDVAPIRPPLRREEKINLEVHRQVAKRLLDDPIHVAAVARRNLPTIRANINGLGPNRMVDEWEALLGGPLGPLVEQLVDESRHGIDMRQNSPFAGVITQGERLEALARVTR